MSAGMSTLNNAHQPPVEADASLIASRAGVARRQRIQDVVFHRGTQLFSLLVLAALVGIIVSLFINAWPIFQKFGIQFIWRVEWDVVNEEFGAAIAIVGTVLSAGIALLIGRASCRERVSFLV